MQMLFYALYNWVNLLKNIPFFRAILFCFILGYSFFGWSQTSPSIYTAPLINGHVEQITSNLARITGTLNSQLNPNKLYNIGIFCLGQDSMVNCEPYPEYNGCYFRDITTNSTISFLMVGDFSEGLNTDKHAILVVFSLPAPTSNKLVKSKNFAGISYPQNSSATIEHFPFRRMVDST